MAIKKTTKKTTSTKKVKASPKKNTPKKSNAKKTPFGGYAINFSGRTDTVEQVFGKKPIPPSEMTKKLWAFVKANGLSN